MYLIYPDRADPDAYERTLPEVFPDTAPGSFTEVPGLGWVWTTFHDYQWDLNYANPAVFRPCSATMLALANRGIDVLRLDAAPFLWKRLGTDCQNQPEAHLLLQAFRALTRLAAPGLVLKAEAIVSPEMLVAVPRRARPVPPECDLAYDNQLMVMLWSTLATRDVRLAEHALSRRRPRPRRPPGSPTCAATTTSAGRYPTRTPPPPGSTASRTAGSCPSFYAGRFPGSFARGALFQDNPATGDARISGMAASLCGIESARGRPGDPAALTAAIRRLESMYAVAFSFGGIPLIYMGDELALRTTPGGRTTRRTRTTTGGCTGRGWTGPRPPGAATRTARGPGVRRDPGPGRRPALAAGAALGRQHRDPATGEPQRAGLPPGAPAQRPVPVADQLQRRQPSPSTPGSSPGPAGPAARPREHRGR